VPGWCPALAFPILLEPSSVIVIQPVIFKYS
jgi:hypothetical protein